MNELEEFFSRLYKKLQNPSASLCIVTVVVGMNNQNYFQVS